LDNNALNQGDQIKEEFRTMISSNTLNLTNYEEVYSIYIKRSKTLLPMFK
jgi:hypothetical protein